MLHVITGGSDMTIGQRFKDLNPVNFVAALVSNDRRSEFEYAQLHIETHQVFYERLAASTRLIPVLMLANILLASCIFILYAPLGEMDLKAAAYLPLCVVSFLVIIVFRNSQIKTVTALETKGRKDHRIWFGFVSFILGCFWALLPPEIASFSGGIQLALALALLSAVLCLGGLALCLSPLLAVPFLAPLLSSCYVTLLIPGTPLGLYLAAALTVYVGLIVAISVVRAQSDARLIATQKTMAKQDKTISLLLRDFDQHSSRFKDAAGRTELELSELSILELVAPHGKTLPAAKALAESIGKKNSFTDIHIPVVVSGHDCWWSITGTPYFSEDGTFAGYHGVGSDITQQKTSTERIQFLAHHDVLTGLYNRAHFSELLNENVSRLERYGAVFSLMFLDLDFFKSVNDTYGHPMGDKLLIEVAGRIRYVMPANAAVSRLGGDEFAVIFADNLNVEKLRYYAEATLEAILRPFEIDGEKLQIGVSIGVALAPHHGTRPDQLLRNVDLALYRAKESGRNAFCVFEAGMDSVARERRALEFDLRYALDANELELFYQPFVNARNGKPIGFEALLRWNHPIRGQISPAEFIPIAEATGLIGPIGEWVIQEACTAAATWPDHLRIAVNLSALQFNKDRVVEIVTRTLAETGLEAHRLELEITESLLIDQPDDAIAKLKHLKNIGVSIAMDDFGTGYSSLSYMLKFPFDKIKVDKSFISAVRNENAASDVLRTIALLGKSLKVKMTAEGVETLEQAEFLKALDFDQLQGFYYSKPLRGAEIPQLLLSLTSRALSHGDNTVDNKVVNLRSSAA
jgi:diguanylate cyclase (GGDEF)-like protein